MERLVPLWMILLIAVYGDAVSLLNNVEENNSLEEPQVYNKVQADVYIKKDDKYKKVTISEDAIFLPHEKYCQYFYVFDGKESNVFSCSKGYYFDSKKLQCLKSRSVDCGKRKKSINSSEEKHIGHIHYKCPKWSGFYAHEHYCHLYYNCQSKKPELMMCPPGLLFDTKAGKCVNRGSVDCNRKIDIYEDDSSEVVEPDSSEDTYSCPESSGVYPHPKHCNKFIRCWFSVGDVYVCPKDTLYDIDLKKCRSKEFVHCEDRKDPYDFEDDELPKLLEEFPDFDCPANKGRFSHEDCAKFYECKSGDAKLYECPQDKLYDSKLKTCKKETEVVCEREIVDEEDEEFICPAKEGIFKDEENCGSYYKCKHGKAQHLTCDEGELFDTDWKSCNDEDDVTCGERILPGDDPEEEEGDNVVDPDPKYECSKRHGRFTHEEICNYYYHCKDGKPSVRNCRRGKYYDSDRNICYEEVDCGKRKPKEDDVVTTPKPREFVCPTKSGKYAHPRNCGAYYTCERSKHKLVHCPKGKLYHEKWRSCANEVQVSCGNRIHPDMDPDETNDEVINPNPDFQCERNYGRYTHDKYCDWFYNCHDKKSSLRKCRRGKYYDSHKRKCIDSKDVTCDGRKPSEDREVKTTTELEPEISTETITTLAPFVCPKKEGKFPHERDCSKFYDCKKGKHKEHKCPKNQLFDDKKWKCEPDKHAKCGSRVHPDMFPDDPDDEIVEPDVPDYNCYNHGRWAHEEYCNLYYNCHDYKPSLRKCKKGKYFDSYRKKCYDEKDVNCGDREKPTEPTTSPTTVTTTTESIPTETEDKGKLKHFYYKNKDNVIDENPDYDCAGTDGLFAHEKHCNYYYTCKNNKAVLKECPQGQAFDSHRERCEDWYLVHCGNRLRPDELDHTFDDFQSTYEDRRTSTPYPFTRTTPGSTTETPFVCPTENGIYPHETNCGKYHVCKGGVVETKLCPEKELFNLEQNRCIDEEETNCGKRIHPKDDRNNKVVDEESDFNCTNRHGCFTHERMCKWYYYCHDNRTEVRECSGDRYFDSERNKCLEWWMVVCDKRITDPETTKEPTGKDTSDDENDSTISTNDENKGTGVTDGNKGTGPTDDGREGTGATDDGRKGTGVTDDGREGTGATDDGRKGTGATDDGRKGTGVTDDGREGTGVTDDGRKGTDHTDDGREGTGVTDDGRKGTGHTDDGREGTRVTDDGKKGTGHTDDGREGTGATDDGREGTGATDDGREGTGVTDDGRKGTGHTDDGRERTGVTDDGRKGTGNTDDGREETGITDDGRKGTGITDDGREGTGVTDDDRKGTGITDDGREETGVTDDGRKGTGITDDGREGTGVTDDGRKGTGNTDDGREGTGVTDDGRKGTGITDDGREGTGVTDDGRKGTGITDDGREETGVTDDGRKGTGITDDGREGTGATDDDRKGTGVTDDGREGTRPTDDGRKGTGVTDDGKEGTEATDDGKKGTGVTDDGREVTGATDDGRKGTRVTDDGREGTGATDDGRKGTDVTDDGRKGTGATDDGRKGTGVTDDGRKGTGATDDGRKGTGVTDDGREGTGATDDGKRGTGVTDDGRKGTGVTDDGREGTGATDDGRKGTGVTDDGREGTGVTDDGRKGTGVTDDGKKGTGVTDEGTEGTGATDDGRKGTGVTDDGREGTGVTDDGRKGTGVTDDGRKGTGATDDGRKGTSVTDDGREGTVATDDGKKGTRVTDEGREGTGATDDGRKGTGATDDGRKGTGATGDENTVTGATDGREGKISTPKYTASTDKDSQKSSVSPFTVVTPIVCNDEDESYAHEEDCELYTQCKDGVASLMKCPEGTVFDRMVKKCYREDWVDCDSRKRPVFSTITGVSTTTEKPIKDECKEEDGDFHHPKDCRLYYTCKDGEFQENECPSGMLFDNVMRICFDEDKVNCGDRYRPPKTTETPDECDEWLRTLTTPIDNSTDEGTTGATEKETGGTEITGDSILTEKITENTQSTFENTETVTENKDQSTPSSSINYTGSTDPTEPDKITVSDNTTPSNPNTDINTDSTNKENTNSHISTDITNNPSTNNPTEGSTNSESISTKTKTDDGTSDKPSTPLPDTPNTKSDEETSSQDSISTDIDGTPGTGDMGTNSDDGSTATDNKKTVTDGLGTSEVSEISTVKISTEGESTISTKTNDKLIEDTTMVTGVTNDNIQTNEPTRITEEITNLSQDVTASTKLEVTGDITKDVTEITTAQSDDGNSISPSGTGNPGTKNTDSTSTSSPITGDGINTASNKDKTSITDNTKSIDDSTLAPTVISTDDEGKGSEDSKTPQTDVTENDQTSGFTSSDITNTNSVTDGSTNNENTSDENNKNRSTLDDKAGSSSSPDDRTGSNTTPDDTTGSNSTPDDTTVSNITPDDTTGSNSSSDDTTGSNSTPDDRTGSKSTPDDITSSNSTPDDKTVTSSTPDDKTVTNSTPDDKTVTNSTPDDKTVTNSTPDDKTGSDVTPVEITTDKTNSDNTDTVTDSTNSSPDDSSDTTHQHSTIHPCLNHTHTTPKPIGPPETDCEKHDVDCIIKETGDVRKWYKCTKKQGNFPHPVTDHLFIRCKDWKPQVKKCGKKQIFSAEYMKCIRIHDF
nr:uncharacterized protein LOC107446911 [Parasteatoda tepidariorum]